MRRIVPALVAGMVVVAGIAASASSQQGQPFERIWNAIIELSARIKTLEEAPPPSPSGGGPVVVDANGVVIGAVIDTTTANNSLPGGATVVLTRYNVLFSLGVRATTLHGSSSLFFTSSDCTASSGAAYVRDNAGVFPSVAVWSPGNTVYVQDRSALPSTVVTHSFIGFDGSCMQSTNTFEMFPARALTDLALEFTPPYRVQMGQ